MNDLHQTFLHAVAAARLEEADDRRRAREAAVERRAARTRRGRTSPRPRRWLPSWRRPAPQQGRPVAAAPAAIHPAAPPAPTVVELEHLLEEVAARAAHYGTRTQRQALAELAAATRSVAPGAAAALVDRRGPEIARLRALGVLHGVALHDLPAEQQAWLLARLQGRAAGEQALVA